MSGKLGLSCPPEVAELMWNTVAWQAFIAFDGYAQPTYAASKNLSCWIEGHNFQGLEANRKANVTEVEPRYDLFFSGDSADARSISLYDLFTIGPIGATLLDQQLQPIEISTGYGPNFDNTNPWIIRVTL